MKLPPPRMDIEWGMTGLPNFQKFAKDKSNPPKVLVLPGAFFRDGVLLMVEAGFERAGTVDEADLVVFMGGADVDPEMYGEPALPTTSYVPGRDMLEKQIYDECVDKGIPMFGICRGAQFIHAMNGGKLWQDVNNHGGMDHVIYDLDDQVTVVANSYHHQMLQDNDDLDVIAITREQVATVFKDATMTMSVKANDEENAEIEIEAGAYHEKKCFFVQGHPEVGSPEYRSWCLTKLHDCLWYWKDEMLTHAIQSPSEKALLAQQQYG